jgi:hypothetical protein
MRRWAGVRRERKMPRYLYLEDDFERELEASNLDDAIAKAKLILSDTRWMGRPVLATMHLRAYVLEVTDDGDEEFYPIDAIIEPDEPECIDSEGHNWQSPYSLVGGIRENPGVWGHGGGVIIEEVCMRCGCGRTIDTWAQDYVTGGHMREVLYSPGEYEDDLNTAETDA